MSQMPDHLFEKFARLIYNESGIYLPSHKKIMLSARLHKRLHALKMGSFAEYYKYLNVCEKTNEEIIHFIDAVSTNKTDFFREPQHFDFLKKYALPSILHHHKHDVLNIWSAGCSSGEEAYTTAFVVDNFFKGTCISYKIIATDISTKVLEKAQRGIYPDELLRDVPPSFLQKYFMKGKGSQKGYHRIVPEIRNKIVFRRHNLIKDDYSSIPLMDIIFFRNVAIYFDRATQAKIYHKLIDHLSPGGYFLIGHSETIHDVAVKLERMEPTVFRKSEYRYA